MKVAKSIYWCIRSATRPYGDEGICYIAIVEQTHKPDKFVLDTKIKYVRFVFLLESQICSFNSI